MNHSGGVSKRRCENARDNIIIGEQNYNKEDRVVGNLIKSHSTNCLFF